MIGIAVVNTITSKENRFFYAEFLELDKKCREIAIRKENKIKSSEVKAKVTKVRNNILERTKFAHQP